ncbi:serine hydroxymethyltransferase, partial [Streptomyces sp. NPDC059627]
MSLSPVSAPPIPEAEDGGQSALARTGLTDLRREDPELAGLLDAEVHHQNTTLAMVASASTADPSVLAAAGSALANVTAEGSPGAGEHPGAGHCDAGARS